jgi:TRAP-type C4-dicarboxylate transport system permease small subunit
VRRVLRVLHRLEDGLLALVLAAMIGLAVTQIVLRNGFDSGIAWADDAVRTGVFWIALVGAMVAARRGHHIRIDALVRLLPPGARAVVDRVVDAATAAVCALLAFHGARFVALEQADGFIAFGGVPVWVTLVVLPIGFALMGARYALHAVAGGPALSDPGATP